MIHGSDGKGIERSREALHCVTDRPATRFEGYFGTFDLHQGIRADCQFDCFGRSRRRNEGEGRTPELYKSVPLEWLVAHKQETGSR